MHRIIQIHTATESKKIEIKQGSRMFLLELAFKRVTTHGFDGRKKNDSRFIHTLADTNSSTARIVYMSVCAVIHPEQNPTSPIEHFTSQTQTPKRH